MDAIIHHIVARLESSAPESEPFPHVFVTELLPPDFYAELASRLPPEERYSACGKRHCVDGQSNRQKLPLLDRRLNRWPDPAAELWRMLRDALCAFEVQQALFRTLAEGLACRYRIAASEATSLRGYPSPTLFRETTGYAIAPHPDTRKKIVTMQLALPETDQQRDLGTTLYRRKLTQLRHSPRGFVAVKQFPFLPNSAYAFVVLNGLGRKSWHGREPLRQDQGVRNTLLNIYGESPGDFPSPFKQHSGALAAC